MVLFADLSNVCDLFNFSSQKSNRFARSIMSGEIYAFVNAFNRAFSLKYDKESF